MGTRCAPSAGAQSHAARVRRVAPQPTVRFAIRFASGRSGDGLRAFRRSPTDALD